VLDKEIILGARDHIHDGIADADNIGAKHVHRAFPCDARRAANDESE